MITEDIVQDQVFAHVESKAEYIVISGTHDGDAPIKTKMRMPSGDWIPAIAYYDPNKSGELYVRDEDSFRQRFERI